MFKKIFVITYACTVLSSYTAGAITSNTHSGLPVAFGYVHEFIAQAQEDGMSEQEAVQFFSERVAKRILQDTPSTNRETLRVFASLIGAAAAGVSTGFLIEYLVKGRRQGLTNNVAGIVNQDSVDNEVQQDVYGPVQQQVVQDEPSVQLPIYEPVQQQPQQLPVNPIQENVPVLQVPQSQPVVDQYSEQPVQRTRIEDRFAQLLKEHSFSTSIKKEAAHASAIYYKNRRVFFNPQRSLA